MVGIFLFFAKIDVIFVAQSFIFKDTLSLSIYISISFNAFLHANQGTKLISDRLGEPFKLDLLVTAWASHETKGDAKGRPLMRKEVHQTVCVENVTTGELRASFRAELARVAYPAEFIFIDAMEKARSLSTIHIETG